MGSTFKYFVFLRRSILLKMKKLVFLLVIALLFSCAEQQNQANQQTKVEGPELNPYVKYIGQHISSQEIIDMMSDIGPVYQLTEGYGARFYNFEYRGVEMFFTETDTLKSVFFKAIHHDTSLVLPYGLKMSDMPKKVMKKIGEPDRTYIQFHYYYYKNLVIEYNQDDTLNPYPINYISVQKLDSLDIFAPELTTKESE